MSNEQDDNGYERRELPPFAESAVTLLDAFEDMAFLIDVDRRVLMMNRALLEILGKRAEEVIGTSIYDYAPLPWKREHIDEIDMMLDTHKPVSSEVEINDYILEVRGFPVVDAEGCITRFAVILRDITETKRLREQVLQAELLHMEVKKDRDLLQKQEKFISMVSHELRNPLTTIRGSLDILEQYHDRLDAQKRKKHFQRIGQQVDAMKALLQDLLAIRQVGVEGFHFSPQPVEAGGCCRRIYDDIVQQAGDSHLFTLIDHSPAEPVLVDVNLLRHILENLMTNAIKYTPEGGEIRLKIDQDANDLIICVVDSGIGIPAVEQAHLFEPFFRAANANGYEGTGLGLPIARTCAEAHGGSINFESVEGRGTTFTVRLPKVQAGAGV